MAYTEWSVVAFEQPTAAKWNQLGTNDAHFNALLGDGWVPADETWTYASADDPTYTFTVSGDKTTKYSAGMKIRLVQTSTKYFIVAKVVYSAPNTIITVYGGTDYDLANAAINNPHYSMVRTPFGFPMNPEAWSFPLIADTTSNLLASVTTTTWFNGSGVGSLLQGDVPIGLWEVLYYMVATCTRTATATSFSFSAGKITLSSANNSESDAQLTLPVGGSAVTGFSSASYSAIGRIDIAGRAPGLLDLSTKTTHYLNFLFEASGTLTNGGGRGDVRTTEVTLVCAYL